MWQFLLSFYLYKWQELRAYQADVATVLRNGIIRHLKRLKRSPHAAYAIIFYFVSKHLLFSDASLFLFNVCVIVYVIGMQMENVKGFDFFDVEHAQYCITIVVENIHNSSWRGEMHRTFQLNIISFYFVKKYIYAYMINFDSTRYSNLLAWSI